MSHTFTTEEIKTADSISALLPDSIKIVLIKASTDNSYACVQLQGEEHKLATYKNNKATSRSAQCNMKLTWGKNLDILNNNLMIAYQLSVMKREQKEAIT